MPVARRAARDFRIAEEREQVAYEVATQTATSVVTSFWIGLTGSAWDVTSASNLAASEVLGEGRTAPSPTARAYVLIAPGAVDSSLARYDTGGEQHAALCGITY